MGRIPRVVGQDTTEERKAKFITLFTVFPYLSLCANKVGVTHAAVESWKHTDPEFAKRVEELKRVANLTLSDRALRVVADRMDVEGKEWLAVKVLETYNPEWKSSTNTSTPVQINISTSIPNPHESGVAGEGELGQQVTPGEAVPRDATATNPPMVDIPPQVQQDQQVTSGGTVEDGGRG